MKKTIFTILLTLSPLFAQINGNMEVPDVSYTLKQGKGADVVMANCSMCHSFGYILNQGKQSHAFWTAKVHKMMNAFKAPIEESDAKIIATYLSTYYGTGK